MTRPVAFKLSTGGYIIVREGSFALTSVFPEQQLWGMPHSSNKLHVEMLVQDLRKLADQLELAAGVVMQDPPTG